MEGNNLFREFIAAIKENEHLTYDEMAKSLGVARHVLYDWRRGAYRISRLQFYGICFLYFPKMPLEEANALYEEIYKQIEEGGKLICRKNRKNL